MPAITDPGCCPQGRQEAEEGAREESLSPFPLQCYSSQPVLTTCHPLPTRHPPDSPAIQGPPALGLPGCGRWKHTERETMAASCWGRQGSSAARPAAGEHKAERSRQPPTDSAWKPSPWAGADPGGTAEPRDPCKARSRSPGPPRAPSGCRCSCGSPARGHRPPGSRSRSRSLPSGRCGRPALHVAHGGSSPPPRRGGGGGSTWKAWGGARGFWPRPLAAAAAALPPGHCAQLGPAGDDFTVGSGARGAGGSHRLCSSRGCSPDRRVPAMCGKRPAGGRPARAQRLG